MGIKYLVKRQGLLKCSTAVIQNLTNEPKEGRRKRIMCGGMAVTVM